VLLASPFIKTGGAAYAGGGLAADRATGADQVSSESLTKTDTLSLQVKGCALG